MTELTDFLPYIVVVWLAIIGLYGMATSGNLFHLIMCLCVFQSSIWILLLSIGYRREATAPIFDDVSPEVSVIDPVMQALSLTDIVVGATIVAILLTIAIQVHKRLGTLDPNQLNSIQK